MIILVLNPICAIIFRFGQYLNTYCSSITHCIEIVEIMGRLVVVSVKRG